MNNVLKTNVTKITQLGIIVFALLFAYQSKAQDLILNTQNEIKSQYASKNQLPNKVAQHVAKYSTFNEVAALEFKEKPTLQHNKKADMEGAVYFTKKQTEITRIMKTAPASLSFSIPVSANRAIELQLVKNDFMANGFKVKTSEGENLELNTKAVFYKGIVKGDPQSIAAISFFNGNVSGIISDKDGNYNLGLMKNDDKTMVLFNEKSLNEDWNGDCGSSSLKSPISTNSFKKEGIALKNEGACDTNDCVGVYCEVDSDFYNNRGSKDAVIEYVTNVFNNASIVFENEGMKICLTHIFIWTSGDNYNGDRGTRLNQFSDVVKDYDFPGTIGVLLYYVPGGDGLANWSDFNGATVLCTDHTANDSGAGGNGAGYGPLGVIGFGGVSANYPQPSRDVQTFTHELGHIFGSPHTQHCSWTVNGISNQAIDGCVASESNYINGVEITCANGPQTSIPNASLMSYCSPDGIPLSNGFGELPGNLMRENYNYAVNNGCLTTHTNDDVFNAYPFLNTLINSNNCNNERVTVYKKGIHYFVHVETESSRKLYNANGDLYCTETTNYDCIRAYDFYEVDMVWACCGDGNDGGDDDDEPQPCDNDNVFASFSWLVPLVDENNCSSEEITVYTTGSYNFIHIQTPTSSKLYFENGTLYCTDSPGYDCVSLYGLSIIEASWACCGGDNDGGNDGNNDGDNDNDPPCDNDNVFAAFPWLVPLVDENNCSSEEINVYDTGNYNYIHIQTPTSGKLYFESGALFCTDSPGYDCVALYGFTVIESTWSCCNMGNLRYDTEQLSESIQVFPNPNEGIFNLLFLSDVEAYTTANMYTIQGKLLKTMELSNLKLQTIDMADLRKGIYILEIVSQSNVFTKRIIVK